MELHSRGWQVYRAYIDEQIDFIIAKYYCSHCRTFSKLEQRSKSFLSNLCHYCKEDTLSIKTRFIQVKANDNKSRSYSFHAKLRSNVDKRSFYSWIALTNKSGGRYTPHFYIFNHSEISGFDNSELDSYQKTDNQKTTLRIDGQGNVLNLGRNHDNRKRT